MASLICKCGKRLTDNIDGNPHIYSAFSDENENKYIEETDMDYYQRYNYLSFDIWECPNSGLWYVFGPDGKRIGIYKNIEKES